MTFERLEALLGWNNSLIPASTYYSQNYSRIIGTGLNVIWASGRHSNIHLRSVTVFVENQNAVIGHLLCLKQGLQLTKMLEVSGHVCS